MRACDGHCGLAEARCTGSERFECTPGAFAIGKIAVPSLACVGSGRGGGIGTRPRYLIVCLGRRPLASRHCSF